jgi:hypothetical protein
MLRLHSGRTGAAIGIWSMFEMPKRGAASGAAPSLRERVQLRRAGDEVAQPKCGLSKVAPL